MVKGSGGQAVVNPWPLFLSTRDPPPTPPLDQPGAARSYIPLTYEQLISVSGWAVRGWAKPYRDDPKMVCRLLILTYIERSVLILYIGWDTTHY